jgi:hypothetical protein
VISNQSNPNLLADDIVDAVADRVRREAPCFSNIAAAETSAVGDRAYSSAREFSLVAAESSIVR